MKGVWQDKVLINKVYLVNDESVKDLFKGQLNRILEGIEVV